MTISGERIYQAMLADPTFCSTTPEGAPREIYRELTSELPQVLTEWLDKLVTLESLLDTKLIAIKHMIESQFMRKLIQAYPVELLEEMSVEYLVDSTTAALAIFLD